MQLDKSQTLNELKKFSTYVVKQSRANLTKGGKNASKKLYNSLGFDLFVGNNSIGLTFKAENYAEFVDKGVSGTEIKYNTPFSFGSKMPPTKALDKWIVKKGIAPRTKQGTFESRENLKFAIAKSIQRKGFKPTLFFTKPFEDGFKRLPNEIIEAYGLDVEQFLKIALK